MMRVSSRSQFVSQFAGLAVCRFSVVSPKHTDFWLPVAQEGAA